MNRYSLFADRNRCSVRACVPNASSRRQRAENAFTLIELLVVIAIITLLAAILFPVFSSAREKARQTACLSNLKEIGTAVMMYVQDADETYPLQSVDPYGQAPYAVQDNPGRASWMGGVQPYLKNIGVMVCPSAVVQTTGSVPTLHSDCSYCYNGLIGNILPGETANPMPIPLMANIARPADTVMLEDESLTWSRSQPGPRWITNLWCNVNANPTLIHNQGFNLAYADGHAKWARPSMVNINLTAGCMGSGNSVKNLNSPYNPYQQ